jgi:beta-lactam-binding protein with PASTA domain
VPEVVGKALQDAEKILKESGLQPGRITFRDDARVDLVLEQSPKAGERVAKETAVDLIVGRAGEVEKVKVPRVIGQTLRGAAEILEAARLKVGEVSGPQDGKVREQRPAAGVEVQVGTPVDLRLSGGGEFVNRLTESIAADSGFATLEIAPEDLRERLVRARVTTPEVAQGVVEMDNQQLQETFGLRNLAHARSFRRMVREALAQLEP